MYSKTSMIQNFRQPAFERPKTVFHRMFDLHAEVGLHSQKPPEQLIREIRSIFLTWLKTKTFVESDAWQGKDFKVLMHSGEPPAEGIALENLWAVQLVDDDRASIGRKWITEFYLDSRETILKLCVRQTCVLRQAPVFQQNSTETSRPTMGIPKFIRGICSEIGLFDAGYAFDEEAWLLEDDSSYASFLNLLKHSERTRPIILLSQRQHTGQPLLNANFLAKHTLGLAHVAVITPELTWKLGEDLGQDLTVFDGAIRTYQPNFQVDDEGFKHPLIIERKISNYDGGVSALQAYLIQQMSKTTSYTLKEELKDYSFSIIRRLKHQALINQTKINEVNESESLSIQKIESLQEQIEQFKEDSHTFFSLAVEEEKNRKLAEEELERLKSQHTELVKQNHSLAEDLRLARVSFPRLENYPNKLDDESLRAWAPKNLTGVHFDNKAYRSAKKSQFEDVELVYKALELLGNEYRNMRLGKAGAQKVFEEKLKEYGLSEEATFSSEAQAKDEGDTYYIHWNGQKRWLDRHLKGGNSREPRYCLRIYFIWDMDTEMVVVGSLPSHLRNRAS